MLKDLKVRVFIYYCYYQGDENEILENGLGFMGTPDLVDFENQKIKYDTDWYENGWFELMENTGFKDSKGNYIFDGDIVKDILGNIMKVEFKHFKWQLIPLNNTVLNMPMVDWFNLETETLNAEIIGNIFEKNNLKSIILKNIERTCKGSFYILRKEKNEKFNFRNYGFYHACNKLRTCYFRNYRK